MKRIRRVLHATDFSKASSRAFSEAVDLAKQNNAELLLVHVIVPPTFAAGDQYAGPELYMQLEEAAKRDAESGIKKLTRKLQQSKVKAKTLLLKGISHDQIVKAAKNRKADLIVIGTHGRTGLSKLFMGSVASRVIASAHCPVLTVRGR